MDDTYCQLIPNNDDEVDVFDMVPRIGAFEVTYKGVLVYSKLLSKMWPNVLAVAHHIIQMLKESQKGASVAKIRQKYQTTGANQQRYTFRSGQRLTQSPSTKTLLPTASALSIATDMNLEVTPIEKWQPRPPGKE